MEKTNSSDDEIKGWLNSLPTKTSRLALKVALTSAFGVPGLLAVLTNITSYPIFSNNKEALLLLTLLLTSAICLVSFLVALVSIVNHCKALEVKIKSLENTLKIEFGIKMMNDISEINKS
jgi:hypothetical protein